MTEIVYHEITEMGPKRFRVEVFRGGEFIGFAYEFGEVIDEMNPVHAGGRKVATLYRPTREMAHEAGITYSFVTSREKFRGTRGPKYGKPVPR